jgi:PilZ domain
MQKLEKRTTPRQALQIPVRFHSGEMEAADPDITSETTNISRSGLFMRSPLRLKLGDILGLTLRVPTYLSGSARADVQCVGRVVHERRLSTGELGYGIHFEQMLTFRYNANSASTSASAAPPSPT